MASNRGPASVNEQEYVRESTQNTNTTTRANSNGVGGSWGAAGHSLPSITITSNPTHATSTNAGGGGTAASDGSYETNLVLELCPPGGMKAVPPPDKLANFSKIVPTLNSDWICPALLDAVEEGQPWVIRAKSLCVMETCIRHGGRLDGTNPYRDFFYACQREIAPLATHSRAQVREPAKRVLALLGIHIPTADVAAPPIQAAPVQEAPNLLDFDDQPATPPPSAPPPTPPTNASMFGGLQVKNVSSSASAANGEYASYTSEETTPVQAAPTSGNLLDFDDDVQQQPDGKDDIFREVTAPLSSMFDQMSLNDKVEDEKKGSEDAGDFKSMASPSGSAFGFINKSTSNESEAPPAPAVFDPLLSPNTTQKEMMQMPPARFDPLMSPTTMQKQMMQMQMSPEQMQAMAYQQMMMQQRMQQMQMAYAMQGRQGSQSFPSSATSNMGNNNNQNATTAGFSFLDTRPAKKDDKKFDFVKDAMQAQSKK
jgi:hypothetical protein